MPELREGFAFNWLMAYFLLESKQEKRDLAILNLWADAAEAVSKSASEKAKATGRPPPVNPEVQQAPDGCPYVLRNTSRVVRGNVRTQKPLFPPPLAPTPENPSPPPIQSYCYFTSPQHITWCVDRYHLPYRPFESSFLLFHQSYLLLPRYHSYTLVTELSIGLVTPSPFLLLRFHSCYSVSILITPLQLTILITPLLFLLLRTRQPHDTYVQPCIAMLLHSRRI